MEFATLRSHAADMLSWARGNQETHAMNAAVAAISEVLQANSRVLRDPAPIVQTLLLGDSSVNIGIRPWVGVADFRAAMGEINTAVLETFRSRGIVLPFPQREVRLIDR
jgi:small conductance mechanosensitive channel